MQLSRSPAALLAVAVAGAAAPAAAQEDAIEVRGVYYKEISNRVVQPRVDVSGSDGKARVSAYYLLDAITSASIAQGNLTDLVRTEYRNEAGASLGYDFGVGRGVVGGRHSREADYLSWGVHGGWSQDFAEKNFTLSAGLALNYDSVRNRFAGEAGTLASTTMTVYGTQILSPTAVGQVGYELQYNDGWQSNVYRFVDVMGGPRQERHPVERDRHTLAGRIAQLFPSTDTTVQLLYRYYFDGWDVRAHSIEPRVYQSLGDHVEVRLSFRYHTQTRAYFFRDLPAGEQNTDCGADADRTDPERRCAYTGDDKLRPFSSWGVEGQLVVDLAGTEGVPLVGWFSAGKLDLSYLSLHQDNTWGRCGPGTLNVCENRVIQLGLTLPF